MPTFLPLFAEVPSLGETITLEWTGIVALVLIFVHLATPYFCNWLRPYEEPIESIGSGLAVAYVFLHLFPELSDHSNSLGGRFHFLVLFGFLIYFAAEHYFESRASSATIEVFKPKRFTVFLSLRWLDSWLIVYALPDSIQDEGILMIPVVLAITLLVLHDDMALSMQFGGYYDRFGRYVLATAPLLGWVADVYFFAEHRLVLGIALALMTGSILYNTFGSELKRQHKNPFVWFLFGTLLFLILNLFQLLR